MATAPPKLILSQSNSQEFQVQGLKKSDGTYLDGAATVTATIKDRNGVTIAGPITMNYQAGAAVAGTFTGQITPPDPTTAVKGTGYTSYIEATDATGNKLHIERSTDVTIRNE